MDVNKELKFLGKFKKKNWGGGGGGVKSRLGGWSQGGCERGIKVFAKIQKKIRGVRVDENEELKFLQKFKKKSGGSG